MVDLQVPLDLESWKELKVNTTTRTRGRTAEDTNGTVGGTAVDFSGLQLTLVGCG